MLFRNLKSGNLVETTNPAVIEVMSGSGNYERVTRAVATPAPPLPAGTKAGNKGGKKGGENATETGEKKPRK